LDLRLSDEAGPTRPVPAMKVEEYRQLDLLKGKRQKGKLPDEPLEYETQCALAAVLRSYSNPEWFWTAFPADGLRTKATAGRMKQAGLRAGMTDFIFISPDGQFAGLELKRGKLGRLSEAQESFRKWCLRHGVAYAVARNYGEAVEVLVGWGVLKTEVGT
jgi:hypothetical protein